MRSNQFLFMVMSVSADMSVRKGIKMAITIKFSMEPKKSLFAGDRWNEKAAGELADQLAGIFNYKCERIEGYLILQFCPEGFLWMRWEKGRIAGECQTNIAGAGFHAAVIHFIELFAAKGQMALLVEDKTGYYEDRDFIKMRRNYFYQWFTDLMNEVLDNKDEPGKQLVCWPSNFYMPEEKENFVVTHIRRFALPEIYGMAHSGMSMLFAKDFFIWNEEKRDAYYFRNCALVIMHQECYFMPSDRSQDDRLINDKIIELLERAMDMDAGIPIPKAEYMELCSLSGHSPRNMDKVGELLTEGEIGCRKGLLYHVIGSMRFAVPGNFLYDVKSQGNSERYYDGRKSGWHDYYICAVNTEGDAQFLEESFHKENILHVTDFTSRQAQGRVAEYQPAKRAGVMVFTLSAQIIYKNQLTIVSISYDDPRQKEWSVDLIKKIQTID